MEFLPPFFFLSFLRGLLRVLSPHIRPPRLKGDLHEASPHLAVESSSGRQLHAHASPGFFFFFFFLSFLLFSGSSWLSFADLVSHDLCSGSCVRSSAVVPLMQAVVRIFLSTFPTAFLLFLFLQFFPEVLIANQLAD